jgi:hypothetical protein
LGATPLAGSGFPLQFLSLPAVGLRDFRFNPLRRYHVSKSPSPYRRQGVKAAEVLATVWVAPSMPKAGPLGLTLAAPCAKSGHRKVVASRSLGQALE